MDNNKIIEQLQKIIDELSTKEKEPFQKLCTPVKNIIFETDDSILMTACGGSHISRFNCNTLLDVSDLDCMTFDTNVLLYTTNNKVVTSNYQRIINYLTNIGYKVKPKKHINANIEMELRW